METYRHLWKRYHSWIGIALSGLLVAMCYGFSLRLPFFFDDLPIMTWLRLHDWRDVWLHSSENSYYRPLAFTVYKLGQVLPLGTRQGVLRAVNLTIHWANAVLIMQLVRSIGAEESAGLDQSAQAVLTSLLFVVFPFVYLAVPWITALSHPLVTMLTLIATLAALRAERDHAAGWWGVSLLVTTLAPFAHESGPICSVIVGGLVMIQYGIRPANPLKAEGRIRSSRRRIAGIILGVMLNIGGVLVRNYVPGVGQVQMAGLRDWSQNTMFFLHGLLYPVAPVIGWLVHLHGAHDFTLVKIATVGLGLLLVWMVRRSRQWRWIASSLWWWACGAIPAAAALGFNYLYISPRLHALSSVGVAMLWGFIIFELGKLARSAWGQRLVWVLLTGAIVAQNVSFLHRQRALFLSLNHVYQGVLEAAADEDNAPLGFVNMPDALAWREKTYALIQENVIFIPWYSGVGEFIEVNQGWQPSDTVKFTPVLQDTEQVFGSQGPGLDWEGMRRFATEHRTVWLARYEDQQFELHQVGTITTDSPPPAAEPLVRFEGGPVIESASVEQKRDGHWAISLTWWISEALDGDIFVHVRDAGDNVVAQADGPALGGTVPVWIWQPGDRVHDTRHVTLPQGGGPYTVQVGVYNDSGRFPAFVGQTRCPDDAATVATLDP